MKSQPNLYHLYFLHVHATTPQFRGLLLTITLGELFQAVFSMYF